MPITKFASRDTLKRVYQKIRDNFAKQNGVYKGLSVGNSDVADNLTATVLDTDTTPYIFRTTGGGADVKGIKRVEKVVGKSVGYNQLVENGNFESTDRWGGTNGTIAVANNVLSYTVTTATTSNANRIQQDSKTLINGHKYLITAQAKAPRGTGCSLSFSANSGTQGAGFSAVAGTLTTTLSTMSVIATCSGGTASDYQLRVGLYDTSGSGQVGDIYQITNIMISDLTQAGLSSVSTIAEFNATDLGKTIANNGYLAYTGTNGAILSVDIKEMVNVGYNAWDEDWELGRLDTTTGGEIAETDQIRSKNYIRVIGGETYTFRSSNQIWGLFYDENKKVISATVAGLQISNNAFLFCDSYNGVVYPQTFIVPTNARYIRFYFVRGYGTTYKNDTCLNITHSGSRTGYEAHEQWSYPINFSGNGIGSVCDELFSDGKKITRLGVVDLSTLNWSYQSANSRWYISGVSLGIKGVNNNVLPIVVCSSYEVKTFNQVETDRVGFAVGSGTSPNIFVYTSDSVNAPKGYIAFELATYTETQETAFTENQLCDDYGTEQFVFNENKLPIPVGHKTEYLRNLKDFLQRISIRTNANPNNIALESEITDLDNRVSALENVITPTTWEEVQKIVRNGLASKVFSIGQEIEMKKGNDTIILQVMGFDQETPVDTNYTHSMTLAMKYTFDGIQFDSREAFFYNGTNAPLPAGTYNFKLGQHSWYSADVGKYIQFTLTQDLPVGGQLVWQQNYNATLIGANIKVFASSSTLDNAPTETVVMSEGQGGTYLGEIKNSYNTTGTYDIYLNNCQRALMGNNRWKDSAIRQWCNSNASAGSVWTPQNAWDRQPSWYSSKAGFLNGVESGLENVIGQCVKSTEKATTDGGGSETTNDKVWLFSRYEIQSCTQVEAQTNAPYSYWHNLLGDTYGDWRTDTRFIKTNTGGSAQYWWLRSPLTGYGDGARFVYASGYVGYTNAVLVFQAAVVFAII